MEKDLPPPYESDTLFQQSSTSHTRANSIAEPSSSSSLSINRTVSQSSTNNNGGSIFNQAFRSMVNLTNRYRSKGRDLIDSLSLDTIYKHYLLPSNQNISLNKRKPTQFTYNLNKSKCFIKSNEDKSRIRFEESIVSYYSQDGQVQASLKLDYLDNIYSEQEPPHLKITISKNEDTKMILTPIVPGKWRISLVSESIKDNHIFELQKSSEDEWKLHLTPLNDNPKPLYATLQLKNDKMTKAKVIFHGPLPTTPNVLILFKLAIVFVAYSHCNYITAKKSAYKDYISYPCAMVTNDIRAKVIKTWIKKGGITYRSFYGHGYFSHTF